MPDSPDYSKYLLGSLHFSLQDLGELAVRQGSYNVFDRRGEVVWWDDFRYGQKGWTNTLHDASDYVKLSVRSLFVSPFNLRLYQVITGTPSITCQKLLGMNLNNKIGIEVGFSQATRADKIDIRLLTNSAVKQWDAGIRLDHTDGLLKYYGSGAAFVTTGFTDDVLLTINNMHFVKFVFDLETDLYTRLMIDSQEYDISSLGVYTEAGSFTPAASFKFTVSGNTTTPTDIDFLYVIITTNEPG